MWRWAFPFNRALTAAACAFALASAVAGSKMTPEDSLESGFPGCARSRESHYLTETQAKGHPSRLIVRYVVRCAGKEPLYAYVDSHTVRTRPETLLIFVDSGNAIERIEVVSFQEPSDYLPRPIWYSQFKGKKTETEIDLRREITPVTGATLTARATVAASRRALAFHRILPK